MKGRRARRDRQGGDASGPGSVVISGDNYGSVFTQVLAGEPAWSQRIDYRRASASLVEHLTATFVGRAAQVDAIESFITDHSSPGYLLVEAPAGYGKSALAAELIKRHAAGALRSPRPVDLVYFFVREEGQRNSAAAFCIGVNSQLLTVLGQPLGVPEQIEGARHQLLALWSAAANRPARDRILLLVVDGLDEQAPESVQIIDLLPQETGPGAKVVVTSRGRPTPVARVPAEHPLHQIRRPIRLKLPPLSIADIEELLATRTQDAKLIRLAPRVHEVTKGEPLFVRFVCEDVISAGEPSLESVEQERPVGVQAYFRSQLRHLISRADNDLAPDILGVLLVSHGAIASDEIAGILDKPRWSVNRALQPLQRFLIGDDRVELMHAELRRVLEDEFNDIDLQLHSERILSWCQQYGSKGWPDTTPTYVRLHYGTHLAKSPAASTLPRLITPDWFRLHALRASVDIFGRDALLASDAAASADPADVAEEVRCSILYAQAGSAPDSWPPSAYSALAMFGEPDEAESYAALLLHPEAKASAFAAIAAQYGAGDRAARVLGMALPLVDEIVAPTKRIEVLLTLADTAIVIGRKELGRELLTRAIPLISAACDRFHAQEASWSESQDVPILGRDALYILASLGEHQMATALFSREPWRSMIGEMRLFRLADVVAEQLARWAMQGPDRDPDSAARVAQLVEDITRRATLLIDMVGMMAATEDEAWLKHFLGLALNAIRELEGDGRFRPRKSDVMALMVRLTEAAAGRRIGQSSPPVLDRLVLQARGLAGRSDRHSCLLEISAGYARMHHYRRARALIAEARKDYRDSPDAARALAWCGDLEDAAWVMARYVAGTEAEDPELSPLLGVRFQDITELARIYVKRGAADAAAELLEAALPLVESNDDAELMSLCKDLIDAGAAPSALRSLRQHAAVQDYAGAGADEFLDFALSAANAHQHDTAIEALQLAIERFDAWEAEGHAWWRSSKLATMARICRDVAKAHFDDAERLLAVLATRASAIADSKDRATALIHLARVHSVMGATKQAKELFGQAVAGEAAPAEVASARLRALAVVYSLTPLSNGEQAGVIEAIKGIVDDWQSTRFAIEAGDDVARIAASFAAQGHSTDSFRLLDQAVARGRRAGWKAAGNVAYSLARTMAELGGIEKAKGLLEELPIEDKLWARASVAAGLAAVGNLSSARQALNTLRTEAKQLPLEVDRAGVLAYAAKVMMKSGAQEDALQLAEEVLSLDLIQHATAKRDTSSDDYNIIEAWEALVGITFELPETDAVSQSEIPADANIQRKAPTSILDLDQLTTGHAKLLAMINQVGRRRLEESQASRAEGQREFDHRAHADWEARRHGYRLANLAWDLAHVTPDSRLSRLVAWAEGLVRGQYNRELAASVASVEALLGSENRAIEVLDDSTVDGWGTQVPGRDKILARISHIYAEHNRIAEALNASNGIADPSERTSALAGLAVLFAQLDNSEEAIALANRVHGEIDLLSDKSQLAIVLAKLACVHGMTAESTRGISAFQTAVKLARVTSGVAVFDVLADSAPGLVKVSPQLVIGMRDAIEQSYELKPRWH
jgi:hypothetical protein